MIPAAHKGPIGAVAAHEGALLSGGYDGAIIRWSVDPDTRALRPQRHWALHAKGINAITWSPDGRAFATGASDGTGALVDGSAPRVVLPQPVDIEAVAFSADGTQLFTGGTDGNAMVWRRDGSRCESVVHGRTVGAIAARPGGGAVTGSNDRRIRWISPDRRIESERVVAEGPIKALAFAGGHLYAASHDGAIRLVGERDIEVARFDTTPKSMCGLGRDLYVAAYDATVSRYRARDDGSLDLISRLRVPRTWGHAIAAAPGFIAVGSFDGRPVVLDTQSDDLTLVDDERARVPCVSAMVFDGERALVGGDAGELWLMNTAGTAPARSVASFDSAITSLALVDGQVVVGTWSGEVARVDREGRVVTLHRAGVPILSVAAMAGTVLVGLYTGGAVAIDARDGSTRWSFTESTGATKCVDVDDRFAAITGRYDPLRVADRHSGRVVARLALDTPVSDVVALRPRGLGPAHRLGVAASNGEVWIVELVDGAGGVDARVIHRGGGHGLPIKALVWTSPDTVAAGDYAGAVRVHAVGEKSREVARIPCRLGVSALVARPRTLLATTFDGELVTVSDPTFNED